MIKQLRYVLLFIAIIGLQLDAATKYTPGIEADGKRMDSILMGSEGGFNGFTQPSNRCTELYINLGVSNSQPAPNNIPTNSYRGSGTPPSLPSTLKHLYIYGNASYFDTLVLGNTLSGPDAPIYPAVAYALPTPARGTVIHFSLTQPPASSPLTWFQSPLPANCTLVIEIGSADPYTITMLPLAGGHLVIGSNVNFASGFSSLLGSATKPVVIQRHPEVDANDAYLHAVATLEENTTFRWAVWGISLNGAYSSTFDVNSEIIDPAEDAANAGIAIASGEKLSIYSHDHRTLPEIQSYMGSGGDFTSGVFITKQPAALPVKSVKPS